MKALEPSGLTVVRGPHRRPGAAPDRWRARRHGRGHLPGPPGGQAARSSRPSPASSGALALRTPVRIASGRDVHGDRGTPGGRRLAAVAARHRRARLRSRAHRRPPAVPRPGRVDRRGAGLGHAAPTRCSTRCSSRRPWKAFERPMYERIVDVPRLDGHRVARPARRCSNAWPAASAVATASSSRRSPPTSTATGSDSVAWHGDRIGKVRSDAIVAILSLGSTRTLLLRPNGGGTVDRHPDATRATCSCRAAPASAPSSTASPSAPMPARASASCSARRAGTERSAVVPRPGVGRGGPGAGLLERPPSPRRDVLLVVEDEPEAEGVQVDPLGEAHVVARQLVGDALELGRAGPRRSRRST